MNKTSRVDPPYITGGWLVGWFALVSPVEGRTGNQATATKGGAATTYSSHHCWTEWPPPLPPSIMLPKQERGKKNKRSGKEVFFSQKGRLLFETGRNLAFIELLACKVATAFQQTKHI